MNRLKWIDHISGFGMDALLLATGILFLTEQITGWTILYVLIVALCFFLPISHFLSIHTGAKPATRTDFLLIFFNFTFGIILLIWPEMFMMFMHVFFGWWMAGHALLQIITFHVSRIDQVPGGVSKLFSGIISAIIAVFMILGRNMEIKTNVLSIMAGIYFLLYGLSSFYLHLNGLLHKLSPKYHSFSISAPVLFTAFLPIRFYISIQKLKKESQLKKNQPVEDCDLWVYIYMKGKGHEMFGHMDIAYEGTIWSYGNHNRKSWKLNGTYGDGILIRADAKKFLMESIHTEKKLIIGYGIKLTEEQKALLEKRLDTLMSRTVPWKPDAQIAEENGEEWTDMTYYSNRLYKETHCDMFSFKTGKFRTYFISSTNCVMLADELIRNKDLRLIDINGIITPGTYLSFLNTEYLKKNTAVVSRVFYEEGVNDPS